MKQLFYATIVCCAGERRFAKNAPEVPVSMSNDTVAD
jgi:hypothetical protein